jgi:hypothetical protein
MKAGTPKVSMKVHKTEVVRAALDRAAVGNVIPINLTFGQDFDKEDKIIITAECCGPYHQCHCPSLHFALNK